MAVISSIHYPEITNDYNEGARCLKNYLRYAEAASAGQVENVQRVLREMLVRPDEQAAAQQRPGDLVTQQVATTLREKGFEVDLQVGQSSFRCDLAVRRPGEREYAAGILVDTSADDQQMDLLEREVMRPKLLEAFGWRVAHVIAKDWYTDSAAVTTGLVRFIEGETRRMTTPPKLKKRKRRRSRQIMLSLDF